MSGNFRQESVLEFSDGEVIFRDGEMSQEMYIIQQGKVEITKTTPKGELTLATLERGDFLGEMSLLENLPRSANAIAKGKTKLLCLQGGGFLLKIRRDPTFAFEMMHALSRRIRLTNDRLLAAVESGETDLENLRKILQQGRT